MDNKSFNVYDINEVNSEINVIEFDLDYKGEFKSMLEDILNRVLEVMYLEI